VISIDTNVLIYAHRTEFVEYESAYAALEGALTGPEPVGFCWPVLHEFLAVVTNPRAFKEPTPVPQAVDQVQDWLLSPVATPLREGARHLSTLRELLAQGQVNGGAVHDAKIAAICVDVGVRELWTVDRDFSRFPQLRTRNPLLP